MMIPIRSLPPEKLWLLFGITLTLTPHFFNQKPVITLCNLAFIAWRLLYEMQILKLPKQITRVSLAILTFVVVAYMHKTVLGLFAGSALLTVMLCLKLLESSKTLYFLKSRKPLSYCCLLKLLFRVKFKIQYMKLFK